MLVAQLKVGMEQACGNLKPDWCIFCVTKDKTFKIFKLNASLLLHSSLKKSLSKLTNRDKSFLVSSIDQLWEKVPGHLRTLRVEPCSDAPP